MIIILLGPPGAGKGTIASEINKRVAIPIIATGDILRNAIEQKSNLGKKVKNYVISGKLVPDEYVIKIVEDRIKADDCEKGFIFDGFPRTIKQANKLDLVFRRLGISIDQVFYFQTSYHTIINRLAGRRVCIKCGTIYNLNYDPPDITDICNKCGGKLIQRNDDKEETIKNRLEIYNQETFPLVSYYQEKDILTRINADQDVEDRFKDLWNRLIKLDVVAGNSE
ncbi:MAG: adenylate kinase [Atribacterota bacterium]|nr:adenylate kinase [Atribacterota bacterium]MDD5636411.1 adenylate kinase [Atribacterota bacterium]